MPNGSGQIDGTTPRSHPAKKRAFLSPATLPWYVSWGMALLAAAAWVAREERRTPRDRDVAALTLVLAAALAASPIVWVHYFLLLLVPLALTRPRLSLLWLVPFAYQPLGEAAWPAGDARKLGLALVATLVLLGAAVLRGAGDKASVPAERRRWRPFLRNPPLRLSPWSRIRSGA
jgi:hypothetical protein